MIYIFLKKNNLIYFKKPYRGCIKGLNAINAIKAFNAAA